MLFSLPPVFLHLNLWPLSLLLTFEVLWKRRPHLSMHPVVYGSEERRPGCMRRYLQGSVQVFWQPGGWRSHSRPEGEDGVTADWVSRADSRRHGWRETSCSTVSSHSLIDFWLRWRAQGQWEIKTLPVLLKFHVHLSFHTASQDGQDLCYGADHKRRNCSGASVFVQLLKWFKCTASKPAARSVFSAVESILLSCSSRCSAAANLMLLSTPCWYLDNLVVILCSCISLR